MPRSLDRLGAVPVPGSAGPGRGGARRRRRWRSPAVVLGVLLAGGAAVAWAGTGPPADVGDPRPGAVVGSTSTDDRPSGDRGAELATPAATLPEPTTRPLGRYEDLELWLPSTDPIVVGYHEAATVAALGIDPVGLLAEDRNTTRTSLPVDDAAGDGYLVLSSRGRSAAPTSAIDVVLQEGDPVLAPVTGTVVDVRSYLLYGAHQDLRIEVVPDDRPDLRLVLIHLDEVAVAIGDHVVAGVSPLAGTARVLPFGSHIDRETEPDRHPHVHLELQRFDPPRLGEEEDEAEAGTDADDAAATPPG